MARLILGTSLVLLLCVAGGPAIRDAEASPDGGALLQVPTLGTAVGFDPVKADYEGAREIVLNLYDQLYEYAPFAQPRKLIPGLAADLPEVSEDRSQYTIRLREGVRFSDDPCFPDGKGRQVRASDLKFCFLRLMDAQYTSRGVWVFGSRVTGLDAFVEASKTKEADPSRSAYGPDAGFPEVAGFEIVNDLTLRIHLSAPYPALAWVLASSYASIYPPEAVAHYGADFAKHLVTTGPWIIDTQAGDQLVVLKRNPGYREESMPALEGVAHAGERLPLSPKIALVAQASAPERWQTLRAGNIDYGEVPSQQFHSIVRWDTGTWQPEVEKLGYQLARVPVPEIHYDAFNMQDELLGHPAGDDGRSLRQAICLAIDEAGLMHRMWAGRADRLHGPILPEFPEFDPDFVNPYHAVPDESREDVVAAAKDLLAEAGFGPDNPVPTITIDVVDDIASKMVFERYKRDLAEIGITVEAKLLTWARLLERSKAGESQMWTISWIADYPDAENFLQLFYGPGIPDPNASRYDNPEFNALYEAALLLPESDERTAYYEEMQELVAEDCPWRFKFRPVRFFAVQPWLRNFQYDPISPKSWKYLWSDPVVKSRYLAER